MKLRLPVWVVFMIYLLVIPSVCLLGLVLLSVFQMFMCHRPIPMSPPALGGLCCAAALSKSEYLFICAWLGLCDSVLSVSKRVCAVQRDLCLFKFMLLQMFELVLMYAMSLK